MPNPSAPSLAGECLGRAQDMRDLFHEAGGADAGQVSRQQLVGYLRNERVLSYMEGPTSSAPRLRSGFLVRSAFGRSVWKRWARTLVRMHAHICMHASVLHTVHISVIQGYAALHVIHDVLDECVYVTVYSCMHVTMRVCVYECILCVYLCVWIYIYIMYV